MNGKTAASGGEKTRVGYIENPILILMRVSLPSKLIKTKQNKTKNVNKKRDREKEREKERERAAYTHTITHTHIHTIAVLW